MRAPSLGKAAALSLAVHMLFAGAVVFSVKRPARLKLPHSPYVVTLVAEPERQEAPGAALKAAPSKKASGTSVRAKRNEAEKAELEKYKAKKIEGIRKKKENKQYRSDRLSAIRAKKALRERAAGVKSDIKNAPSASAPQGQVAATGASSDPSAFSDYYAMVSDRIWDEWVFPSGADEAAGLETIISIKVQKDGSIKIKDIEKSSGNPLFDGSALKAINRASPLRPPPFEMEIGIRFTP